MTLERSHFLFKLLDLWESAHFLEVLSGPEFEEWSEATLKLMRFHGLKFDSVLQEYDFPDVDEAVEQK